jgi:hypothetical protein
MASGKLAATLLLSVALAPQTLSLKDVTQRVGAYVDGYGDKASIVVATERYSQIAVNPATQDSTHREIVSDFAIVRTQERRWIGFRDVLELDGKRIEDRQDRLLELLTSGGLDEARRVTEESARFNVGSVVRDFNVPSAALFFFTSGNLDRFKFTSRRDSGDALWRIDFQESETPTLIRTPEGQSIRSAGTLSVEPDDGAIVGTLLDFHFTNRRLAELVEITVNVDVKYARIEALGMWLPAIMMERYDSQQGKTSEHITTRADYSNYRTFQASGRIK